jgi:hypothetical protein
MSLQGCLASRQDCFGDGRHLLLKEILEICRSTLQGVPIKSLFIVLPEGEEYTGGIYRYDNEELTFITDKIKTNYIMELYPELIWKEQIEIKELIRVGIIWQYLSLKMESMSLGISQRAKSPKKINKVLKSYTDQNYVLLYSVAVRGRDHKTLVEDLSEPLQKESEEGIYILSTPECYRDQALYENRYQGVSLEAAIFKQIEKKPSDQTSLDDLSQLLWSCQGETDHTTHGNRDALEKNGYGRVHASGCAGYSVYPIIFVEELANIPKGAYWYNPIGFSALNRWICVDNKVNYDHLIHKYSSNNSKTEIGKEFDIIFSNFLILLCIDRKKPCSGFMHSKIGKVIMDTKYWAEIEAGMALAGLQLQANALGYNWQKTILGDPDDARYKRLFNLDSAERSINQMASNLVNLPKNEKLSLKGHLIPTVLFSLK